MLIESGVCPIAGSLQLANSLPRVIESENRSQKLICDDSSKPP